MPHKRPSCDGSTGPELSQTERKKKKLDESLFGEVLLQSGFILNFSNEPYTLETDQALFQKRLRKALRSHPVHGYPASVKEFMRGLDDHISSNGQLRWSLLYTQTAAGCAAAARAGHQDSLLRLLLNMDELQAPLVTLMVERLLEVAYSVSSGEDHSLPRLILANLQRLDRLADAGAVSQKMLELLQGAPPEVQNDIITFLPEIVDDASHPKVAEELCKLFYSSPDLSVAILDSLPGLSLSPQALLDVKHSVQKTLQAARPEHLPVVVKFLLEDAGRAEELIADLRRRVRLGRPTDLLSQRHGAPDDSANHEMALLQNVRFAFQVDKRQHMSWLKALDAVCPPEVHHPLDVLLLLQLHDTAPARQRLVEAVLRKKVRAGHFSRAVLRDTFAAHAQTLKQFISTLRRLAAFLLRCSEPSLSDYGAEIYRLGFVSFSGYHQQEMVIGLLSHSSDPPATRQAALRLFQTLAEHNTDALARYSGFLKSWLDLLDQLTLPEARQLMEVLSTLAFRAPQEAASVGDELRLLVHKQLASSYKRLGVISVLMAIKCRQNSGDTSTTTVSSGDSQLGSLVWRAGLDAKIENWICDQLMDEFQETFVVDLPDSEPQCDALQLALKHGLEEPTVGEIALNIMPIVLESGERLVTLCAHFRLLRMKGKAKSPNGTLNQSGLTQLEKPTAEERPPAPEEPGPQLSGYRPFLRELDMDVYKLLYRRLSLTDNTSEEVSGCCLGFAHLDLLPEASVARQAVTLLKPLSLIADTIVGMFRSQIADNDGVLDGPGMFGEEPSRLAGCLSAVYRIVALLLSWPGLAEPDNQQLAHDAVANLRLSDGG
ncbi:Fanconi anemia group D2 protein-like [Pollicipes pollicipes]|uniref:Fanconi anemia group D2 protein-like n=1 Tax=Pollicipes pollicipes TaxID=41117 RepID=UPI0018855CE1|nr:Fanconi anemia group D2 protein-like [Pollicipes pollicipes]